MVLEPQIEVVQTGVSLEILGICGGLRGHSEGQVVLRTTRVSLEQRSLGFRLKSEVRTRTFSTPT